MDGYQGIHFVAPEGWTARGHNSLVGLYFLSMGSPDDDAGFMITLDKDGSDPAYQLEREKQSSYHYNFSAVDTVEIAGFPALHFTFMESWPKSTSTFEHEHFFLLPSENPMRLHFTKKMLRMYRLPSLNSTVKNSNS
ncbi:MAG: hypothetical protein AAFQ98_09020 [Bacteroidota bacterium]